MKYDKNSILLSIIKNEYEVCTKEDLFFLDVWYDKLDEKSAVNNLENIDTNEIKATIWEAILSKIEEEEKVIRFKPLKSVSHYILSIAATLALIIGSYLVLNKIITKPDVGTIYLTQINNTNKPSKIILPDNSLIWLQSKSAIKYPKIFIGIRKITLLSGKVFFNIKHDSRKPFIVETVSGLKTTVLGTAFVVEYGKKKNSFKISVLRGSVKVSDKLGTYATLSKNQGITVNMNTKKALTIIVDSVLLTKWFNSKVVLDNVTLKIVAASLSENYGFKIDYSSEKLLSKSCSITYNSTDNLNDILSLLDKIYHTKHTFKDNKTVYIKPVIRN